MARSRVLWLTLAVLMLVAASCGGDDGGGGGGGNVDVDDDGGVTVELPDSDGTPGGEVTIGTEEIPEGFPAEFPIPDGSTAVYSVGAEGTYGVWFSSSEDIGSLEGFFDAELPANGWTVASKTDFSDETGEYSIFIVTGNGFDGGVYLGEGAAAAGGFGGEFAFFVSLTASVTG